MKLLAIKHSTRQGKRLMAIFQDKHGKEIVTHFGLSGASTFIDHRDIKKKEAYIARHSVKEDWTDPLKAGTLSRYLLWAEPTLHQSILQFRKRFDV